MTDWDEPSTVAVLALLIGIALGTLSGYELALERAPFTVDNRIDDHDAGPTPVNH